METMVSVQSPPTKKARSPRMLLAIGLFKLVKAASLIAVGIGAIELLHKDVASTVTHWIEVLRVDPDNRIIHGMLTRVFAISPAELKAASVGTFLYAALLLTEAVGLLLRKRWGEYLTIVATAGLIPLELYEIVLHVTPVKILVLLVNAGIVAYLIWEVRRSAHAVHG
jgi:uncharacterized membrane protein (DUF2068 family)